MTPLEALENIRKLFIGSPIDLSKQLNIIETALKQYEIDVKDLKAKNSALMYLMQCVKYYYESQEFTLEDLGKKLKALEIIKKKKVNVWCISRVSLEEYNTKFVNQEWRKLTQEEYDLLREVLYGRRKDAENND